MKLFLWIGLVLSGIQFNLHAAESGGGITGAIVEPKPVTTREDLKPHVGIRGGLAGLEDRYQTPGVYGLDVGFQPYIPYSLGLQWLSYGSASKIGSDDRSLSRSKLLGRASYNFGGTNALVRYSSVGLGVGPVFDRFDGQSVTELGIEPTVGFDIPVLWQTESQFRVTAGANLSYLIVSGGSPESLQLDGAMKYWF